MSEVCPNVATEPTLQPVTNEQFFHCSANTECGAHLDVRAQGFWVFTINKLSLMFVFSIRWQPQSVALLLPAVSDHMTKKKTKDLYEQHVREIERASFTLLVFSALGGMSKPTDILLLVGPRRI